MEKIKEIKIIISSPGPKSNYWTTVNYLTKKQQVVALTDPTLIIAVETQDNKLFRDRIGELRIEFDSETNQGRKPTLYIQDIVGFKVVEVTPPFRISDNNMSNIEVVVYPQDEKYTFVPEDFD